MKHDFDFKILEDTINDIRYNPNAVTLLDYNDSSNTIFMAIESNPDDQLKSFMQYMYDHSFVDINYLKNYEKIRNKSIDDYSYSEVITALSNIFRSDRFISGQIYASFKDGSLLKLLEKLKSFIP